MSRRSSSKPVADADSGLQEQRRDARRSAVVLALVALAVFVAFIAASVLRSGAVN